MNIGFMIQKYNYYKMTSQREHESAPKSTSRRLILLSKISYFATQRGKYLLSAL